MKSLKSISKIWPLTVETPSTMRGWVDGQPPLRPALSSSLLETLQARLPPIFLSMGWRWRWRPFESMMPCRPLTPSVTVAIINKGIHNIFKWGTAVSFDTPSRLLQTVVFPVDAHFQLVLHQTAGVLLEGPWLILGESYLDDLNHETTQTPIRYLSTHFCTFLTPKS